MDSEQQASTYKRTWGPTSAILVVIGIFFASQFIAGLLLGTYSVLRGWSWLEFTAWLSASVIAQFLAVLCTDVAALLLLWYFLKSRKATPADIGLKKPKLVDVIYAFGGFFVYFLCLAVIMKVAQNLFPVLNTNQCQDIGFHVGASGISLSLIFVSLVILPPVTEEILVRGFLYTGLRTRFTVIRAAILTSMVFAVAHLQIGNGQPLLWAAAIDTFVLSLVLVYLRQQTDRLWAPIMVHMIKNSIAFMALFVLKAACA